MKDALLDTELQMGPSSMLDDLEVGCDSFNRQFRHETTVAMHSIPKSNTMTDITANMTKLLRRSLSFKTSGKKIKQKKSRKCD